MNWLVDFMPIKTCFFPLNKSPPVDLKVFLERHDLDGEICRCFHLAITADIKKISTCNCWMYAATLWPTWASHCASNARVESVWALKGLYKKRFVCCPTEMHRYVTQHASSDRTSPLSFPLEFTASHRLRQGRLCSGARTWSVGMRYAANVPVSSNISVDVRVAAQLHAGRPT